MIILSGASGGIGSKLISHLETIDEVVGTYFKHKPEFGEHYQLDVTDEESILSFLESISPKLRRITLINLAGISIDKLAHNLSLVDWDRVLAINLTGSFLMAKHLLPYMLKEKWGRIINISSVVPQLGIPGTSAYAASKSGLIGLTTTLAKEYALQGITTNCISLGYFSSGLIDTLPDKKLRMIKEKIPMKKLGEVKDLFLAIAFLIECEYITGANIKLDGGFL